MASRTLALSAAAASMVALPAIALPAIALAPAAHASAPAHSGTTHLWGKLSQLNDSGATGTVTASLTGDQLSIKIVSHGLLAGAPHAQHIHIGGSNTCPSNDTKGTGVDGHLRVADAMNDYGMIAVSLTTSGDTSPGSGLAVTRFPVGSTTYSRTITVSDATAASIRAGKGVVVQHGVDYNGDGKYSGSSKSELDPSLPEEATDPANCGRLEVSQMSGMPTGGVQTGAGASDDASAVAFGGAATALTAAIGFGYVGLRRRAANRI